MQKIRFSIAMLVISIVFCTGCRSKDDKEIAVSSKISKSEAISIAWNAFKEAESEEIALKYHVDDALYSEGSWSVLFLGPDPGVLGDDFLVIVNDDKTAKVLPGE